MNAVYYETKNQSENEHRNCTELISEWKMNYSTVVAVLPLCCRGTIGSALAYSAQGRRFESYRAPDFLSPNLRQQSMSTGIVIDYNSTV